MNTLVAVSPSGMVPAQQALLGHITGRVATVKQEFDEATGELEYAREHKWRTTALQTIVNRLMKKLRFYDKLKAAVEAGYVIMPSLPMDVIAIRTRAVNPSGGTENHRSSFRQEAQALAQGEGEYKNPLPITDTDVEQVADGKGGTKDSRFYFPTEFQEEFAMPVELCKPMLLEKTNEAMALELFDEIGVVRDNHAWNRRGDPIIVGTILDPTRRGRRFAFFIAWALPLGEL